MHLHFSPFHVNSTLDDELASPIDSIIPARITRGKNGLMLPFMLSYYFTFSDSSLL